MPKAPTRVGWLGTRLPSLGVSGAYDFPSSEKLRHLAMPRGTETDDEARRRILDDLANQSAIFDRQVAALMTVAGFLLAINGLLLDSGELDNHEGLGLSIPSALALYACFASFSGWVDRGPGGEESFDNLDDARAVCMKKRFWAWVATQLLSLALGIYLVALFFLAFL